jgi:hypothetical protein
LRGNIRDVAGGCDILICLSNQIGIDFNYA